MWFLPNQVAFSSQVGPPSNPPDSRASPAVAMRPPLAHSLQAVAIPHSPSQLSRHHTAGPIVSPHSILPSHSHMHDGAAPPSPSPLLRQLSAGPSVSPRSDLSLDSDAIMEEQGESPGPLVSHRMNPKAYHTAGDTLSGMSHDGGISRSFSADVGALASAKQGTEMGLNDHFNVISSHSRREPEQHEEHLLTAQAAGGVIRWSNEDDKVATPCRVG